MRQTTAIGHERSAAHLVTLVTSSCALRAVSAYRPPPLLPANAAAGLSASWGAYALQRRALAVIALLLEAGQEASLATLCTATGASPAAMVLLRHMGLAQRLMTLAGEAAEAAASAAEPSSSHPHLRRGEANGTSGQAPGTELASVIQAPASLLRGRRQRQRQVDWGGERARLTQEALLLLKAMLLSRDELRTHALLDLTADPEAQAAAQCAAARLAEAREAWGAGRKPGDSQSQGMVSPATASLLASVAGPQQWPELLLAPWAQQLMVSTSVDPAAAAVSAGGAARAGLLGCSLDAVVTLNSSVHRRFLHRMQHLQQLQRQQQEQEMAE